MPEDDHGPTSAPAPDLAPDPAPEPVVLTCTACPARRTAACDDCVVNVLWRDRRDRPAEVRAAEAWGVERVW